MHFQTQTKDNLKAATEELEAAEEEKNIQKERQIVISQDNEQLKVTIAQLKERIESAEQLGSAEASKIYIVERFEDHKLFA